METNRTWIPCKEREPEHIGEYITTDELGIVETSLYFPKSDKYCEEGWNNDAKIIAWMEFPPAYEE